MPPEPAALGRTCSSSAAIISAMSTFGPISIDPPAADAPRTWRAACKMQQVACAMSGWASRLPNGSLRRVRLCTPAETTRRDNRRGGVQPLLALRSAGGRAAPAPARASRSESARPGPDLRLAQRPIMIASGRAQRALQISRAARLSHTDTATAKYATKARDKVAQFQAPGFSESV